MIVFAVGIVLLFWIIGIMAVVWVIYDVLTNQNKMPDVEKLLWIILAFFTTVLGALIYYLLVKREGKYEEGSDEHMENPDEPIVY